MRVYYFDDAGDRAQRTDKDPWFVLGGFGIDVEHIPALNYLVKNTSSKYGLNLEYPREIKFYHIGKSGHGKNENKRNWMVDAGITNIRQRRALGMSVLRHGIYLPSVRVISVAVDRRKLPDGENPVLPAVKLLLDRVQMDLQDFETNGFVLMDEENAMDKDLRQALRTGSGLIKKYTRILDTIAFMPSEESPGIQVADLVAGGIARYQNTNDPGFARIIWPRMRHRNGVQAGYGIKLHPNNPWVVSPPEQVVPWPQFDRDVHDFEFQARGQIIHWSPDGRPSSVWQVLQVPSV